MNKPVDKSTSRQAPRDNSQHTPLDSLFYFFLYYMGIRGDSMRQEMREMGEVVCRLGFLSTGFCALK